MRKRYHRLPAAMARSYNLSVRLSPAELERLEGMLAPREPKSYFMRGILLTWMDAMDAKKQERERTNKAA